MTELLPCPFCGSPDGRQSAEFIEDAHFYRSGDERWEAVAHCPGCGVSFNFGDYGTESEALQCVADEWNRRAPVAVPAAAKPSTCCPGEHLVPMHSTDTKLCTGCKTEKHWPLEPGQKRTY